MDLIKQLFDTKSLLREINLNHKKIGHQESQYLSEALKMNTVLTTLDLWCNQIGDQGTQYLSEALEKNTIIITLGLEDNQIDDINTIEIVKKRLRINQFNKKRLSCLQILCLEKMNQLNLTETIKNTEIYESCMRKYQK